MTDRKYKIDTEENRGFLRRGALRLLEFGRRFPSPGGGSYYLGDDGIPWKDRNRETWITSRMAHVYSIGSMLGVERTERAALDAERGAESETAMSAEACAELAEKAIAGLAQGELRDNTSGGWYAGLTADGSIIPSKQCYAHAFVILAASSAYLAGIDGAEKLLREAIETYDRFFWNEEEGLAADTWNTEFTELDTYRGLNANMHTVEAFLAAADALGDDTYRIRAGRIISRVIGWAEKNDYRIPEHYSEDWTPDLDMNIEKPDDPFKPYGATPGHGIEWARLITQWSLSAGETAASDGTREVPDGKAQSSTIKTACRLYERAVADAWNADGAPGLVYTTDWKGSPVVHDRMHWTLAEAINTSAVLYRVTGDEKYTEQYEKFMRYLDESVLDKSCGSWYHQLDENNKLKSTVWPGKPDLYHAFQAMLIPYSKPDISIAAAVRASIM
jgi:mannose/cellobiose epimerase-like protein (N-acyl-D-glucosamine 2-epimerase family)